jgi:CHASE3 domain sensor protein
MNKITSRIILLFAAIGLCAVIYGAWHYYQERHAADAAQAIRSAPIPNDIFDKHTPPPRQP